MEGGCGIRAAAGAAELVGGVRRADRADGDRELRLERCSEWPCSNRAGTGRCWADMTVTPACGSTGMT